MTRKIQLEKGDESLKGPHIMLFAHGLESEGLLHVKGDGSVDLYHQVDNGFLPWVRYAASGEESRNARLSYANLSSLTNGLTGKAIERVGEEIGEDIRPIDNTQFALYRRELSRENGESLDNSLLRDDHIELFRHDANKLTGGYGYFRYGSAHPVCDDSNLVMRQGYDLANLAETIRIVLVGEGKAVPIELVEGVGNLKVDGPAQHAVQTQGYHASPLDKRDVFRVKEVLHDLSATPRFLYS